VKTRGQESLGLGVGLEVGDQAGHLIQPLGAAVQGADEGLEDLSLAPRRQPSVSLRVPPTLEERLDPPSGLSAKRSSRSRRTWLGSLD